MSKRTRTPAPDAALDALKAAECDASILSLNLCSDATDAAKHHASLRRQVIELKEKVVELNARCNATGYACDVDDAVDAERRLAALEAQREAALQAALAAVDKWVPYQRAASAAKAALDAYRNALSI